jgi:hypothetical protein
VHRKAWRENLDNALEGEQAMEKLSQLRDEIGSNRPSKV